MRFRIQSRAKSSLVDQCTEREKSRIVTINEVLEFDHQPSGDEIQNAIANLPKYEACKLHFLETLAIKKLPD